MAKYAQAVGFIQKFGDKPAVVRKEQNNQTLQEFTIKADWPGQPLVKVTLWGEYADFEVPEDAFVAVDGKYEKNVGSNGTTYHNLTAYKFVCIPSIPKAERAVVNSGAASGPNTDDGDPF